MRSKTIRITICNLQTGIGTRWGYWHYLMTAWKYFLPHGSGPVEQAASFIRSEAVDLAAFCEIEGGSRRTRGVDQVAMISDATDLKQNTFFPTLVLGARVNQGNAVCTRFPLRHVKNHALPGIGEPRFLSEAEAEIDGMPVHVFVTHLSLERKIRTPQIHHMAEIIGQREGPTLLAGDFNVSEEAELKLLVEGHLQQAASAPTFPAWKPVRLLDHLFLSKHFVIHDTYTFDRVRFSDHLPFVAEVSLQS